MTRLAFVLAYDGTSFAGWQRQDGASQRTVQGTLEGALSRLVGATIATHGASRTDAGVHALHQVAHADVDGPRTFAAEDLRHRLDGMLPEDLRLRAACAMDTTFHARRSAVGKIYEYRLHVAACADPLERRTKLHVLPRLHLDSVRRAARLLEGERDFAALRSAGSDVLTTVRLVRRCELVGEPPDVRLVVEGSGFLRHMVRAMMGSLLLVGEGQRPVEWISEMLSKRERSRAGPNAPAHGLVLARLLYPDPHAERIDRVLQQELGAGRTTASANLRP